MLYYLRLLSFYVLIANFPPAIAQDQETTLAIENAYIRAIPPSLTTTAAYLSLYNPGDKPVTIRGIHCDVAATAELHESAMDQGVMKMRPVPELTIAAGAKLELAPGGLHIMLSGLKQEIKAGDKIALGLNLSSGPAIITIATVRDMRMKVEHDHQHHH